MLVVALNPCPCGYYGDLKRECRCSPVQIERYRGRISGPLLDRIDIHVNVPLIEYRELRSSISGESSAVVRERVVNAKELQRARFAGIEGVGNNSQMHSKLVEEFCALNSESIEYLEMAMNELNFSARAHDRILKVSRTLADLDDSVDIKSHHVMEAVQYRVLDRKLSL